MKRSYYENNIVLIFMLLNLIRCHLHPENQLQGLRHIKDVCAKMHFYHAATGFQIVCNFQYL